MTVDRLHDLHSWLLEPLRDDRDRLDDAEGLGKRPRIRSDARNASNTAQGRATVSVPERVSSSHGRALSCCRGVVGVQEQARLDDKSSSERALYLFEQVGHVVKVEARPNPEGASLHFEWLSGLGAMSFG